ncbi:MAG: SDR family oxidoreductase [Leptospirales bacterium]
MSLYGLFQRKSPNGFGYNTTAEEVTKDLSLSGKTILITGCNSGLGKETARVLAKRGAKVFGTARTLEKARNACAEFGQSAVGLSCELSDPQSVRSAVKEIKNKVKKLDVIICNAGIMALPKLKRAHGYELQFFTNHIGHFILVTGLLDHLSDNGRVVMLSSAAHKGAPSEGIQFDNLAGDETYTPWSSYGQSKFANLLFARELARRFEDTDKVAIAVHPGVIKTNLGRHMNSVVNFVFGLIGPLFLKNIPQGAATECYAAVHPGAAEHSGSYFADCNPISPRSDANNMELASKLWQKSEEIVAGL